MVRYVQLAHNRRVGGVTRAEVLLNLGREDELDVEGLRRLARSITPLHRSGERRPPSIEPAERARGRRRRARWAAPGCWTRCGGGWGSTEALREVLGRTAVRDRCRAGAVRAGREPGAGAVLEAGRRRVGLRGRRDPRAGARWTRIRPTGRWTCWSRPTRRRRCRRRCSSPCADLLEPRGRPAVLRHHLHLLRDRPRHGRAGSRRSGRYGHSKDHRPDLPQVVIGLAVTREGIPVRVWVWPGNTNDQTVISPRSRTTCAAGGSAASSRSSTAASPPTRTCAT